MTREATTTKCYCPGDCNCRFTGPPWHRFNYCGCRAHDATPATTVDGKGEEMPATTPNWYCFEAKGRFIGRALTTEEDIRTHMPRVMIEGNLVRVLSAPPYKPCPSRGAFMPMADVPDTNWHWSYCPKCGDDLTA